MDGPDVTAIISEASKARDEICAVGASLFDRGLTSGSTGNISLRLGDGAMVMTPTNASLGDLDPARLSFLDAQGNWVNGDKPTKEAFLHTCMYCAQPNANGVVHLHSTNSVAVSILADIDPSDVLPPLTAYYVMKVGRLPLVPYFAPGDVELARAVQNLAGDHHAVLLANHGPVVSGKTLREAQYAIEELEETARLHLMLDGRPIRPLTQDQVAELHNRNASLP